MAESVEQPYEWLVIFLVYNNIFSDAKKDKKENPEYKEELIDYSPMEQQTKYILNQIRHTKYNEKVKTVFVEAEIKENGGEVVFATLSMLRKKWGTWLSAVDKVWRDGSELNVMTDAESLQDILTKLKNKYDAKKHMIITVGHGSVTGINYYLPKLSQKVNKAENALIAKELKNSPKGVPVVKEEILENDAEKRRRLLFLHNQELSDVIGKVFNKVDVMVMYNCLMQNIFTQYAMSRTVDWFVAPLSGISIPGFNYGAVLNEINTTPGIEAEAVAELFINSIHAGNRYSSFKQDIEGTWNIAAIQLNAEHYKALQNNFERLFEQINSLKDQPVIGRKLLFCMQKTIRHTFSYSNYCLPGTNVSDIGVFLQLFKENIVSYYAAFKILVPLIENLQLTLKQLVKQYKFEGADFYKSEFYYVQQEKKYKDHAASSGLLLPLHPISPGLFEDICNGTKYPPEENGEYFVPSFLLSKNYGEVICKLSEIPWD